HTKRHLHTVLVVPALVMMLALAGCSGSDDEPAAVSEKSSTDAGESSGKLPSDAELAEKSGGNPDRPFGSTDEAVITAVTSATQAEDAEWDGKMLRVFVDGSVNDPTAGLYCSSIHTLIADDE